MRDIAVIDDPSVALSMLDPIRADILAALIEPGSATTIAAELALPRQKINYHLRALEEHGLVELHEERQRRGLTERVMIATAETYLLSPGLMGSRAPDPARTDRLSTRYLLALAARLVREVAELARGADTADKPLATLSIDTEIRFSTADDRAAFTRELTDAITHLAARYHDESAPRGKWHRLIVAAHPHPPSHHPPLTGTQEGTP